jgi:hypothetical protein
MTMHRGARWGWLWAGFSLVACTTDHVSFTFDEGAADASDARAADAKHADVAADVTQVGDARAVSDHSVDAPSGDDASIDAADALGEAELDSTRAIDATREAGDGSSNGPTADGSNDVAVARDATTDAGADVTRDATVSFDAAQGPIFDPCSADPQLGFDPLSSGLVTCCDVGPAHCVPKAQVVDRLADQLTACGDPLTVCMPDAIIRDGAFYRPGSCTSSLGNVIGACISRCIALIRDNAQSVFLQQDDCGAGDLCVPCVNPLNNVPTGACELESLLCPAGPVDGGDGGPDVADATLTDAADVGDAAVDASADASVTLDATADTSSDGPAEASPDAGISCPYQGPPLIDPNIFPSCAPACGGAHCIPQAALPAAATVILASCASTGGLPGVCAPDAFIASAGNTVPTSCAAFAGTTAPGRCLSECLPAVASQSALEPSTCAAGSKCVPCNDPFSGASTGACSIACDQPPPAPFTFAGCCPAGAGFDGRCIPRSQIPDEEEASLVPGTCTESASLCVPNDLLTGAAAAACSAVLIPPFTYAGRCLSSCLNLGIAGALPRGNCSGNHVCFPCAAAPGTPGCQ